jgi:hypothetical protein
VDIATVETRFLELISRKLDPKAPQAQAQYLTSYSAAQSQMKAKNGAYL